MDNQPPAKTPDRKTFKDIALCLSGGGYRAAAFHFGSIDMLEELGLLDKVMVFSTASGGTITAVAYVLSKIEKKETYPDFFIRFKTFLEKTNIVKEVLDKACYAKKEDDVSLGAFAGRIYQDNLFGDNPGNSKRDLSTLMGANNPFRDLIFNATELRVGNSFRFRVKKDKQGKPVVASSNYFYNFSTADNDIEETIKLGDVVATSSCFPGVFDPIIFPDNFNFDDVTEVKKSLKNGFKDGNKEVSLPLMDGGIFDNQGVYSFLLSNHAGGDASDDEGENDDKPDTESSAPGIVNTANTSVPAGLPDLVIIADSNPLKKDLYPLPLLRHQIPKIPRSLFLPKIDSEDSFREVVEKTAKKAFQLANVSIATFAIILLIGLISLVWAGLFIGENNHLVLQTPAGIFSVVIPGIFVAIVSILAAAAIYLLFVGKKWISQKETFIKDSNELKLEGFPAFNVWRFVKKTNLAGLIRFLEARLMSTLALTTDLFLKRVRDLGTKGIMTDEQIGPRVAFNYITDLAGHADQTSLNAHDAEIRPTCEMIDITDRAGKYQTNLWCTKPEELEEVIMAGQISICHSLLRHMWKRWTAENADAIKKNKVLGRQNQPLLKLTPGPNVKGGNYHELYKKAMGKWMEFKKKERVSYERVS